MAATNSIPSARPLQPPYSAGGGREWSDRFQAHSTAKRTIKVGPLLTDPRQTSAPRMTVGSA
jgi:hypothetical protein